MHCTSAYIDAAELLAPFVSNRQPSHTHKNCRCNDPEHCNHWKHCGGEATGKCATRRHGPGKGKNRDTRAAQRRRVQVARSGSFFSTSGLGISRLSTIGSPWSSLTAGEEVGAKVALLSHDDEGGCAGDGGSIGGEMDLAGGVSRCGVRPPRPAPSLHGSLSDSC